MSLQEARKPRIVIFTVAHGAAHVRVAQALRKALLETKPDLTVSVVDALSHCRRWFRAYYNSYLIPLKYWLGLWGWIEGKQHAAASTGPKWLYRKGGQPLCRFFQESDPEVIVVTEVGLCELAAMMKREARARFRLVGMPTGVDIDRAWAQREVELFCCAPGEAADALCDYGVSRDRIIPTGMPIDPVFCLLPDRATARQRLEVMADIPMLLILFGGTGHGKPRRMLRELSRIHPPLQTVFITGKNQRLERELRQLCRDLPRCRVLGWADNMHEWMAAADLLLSKPGSSTVIEALACGLPMLALDPLPGMEYRTCAWIEKQKVGYWLKSAEEAALTIERLLARPEELRSLRENSLAHARPFAAREAAKAILHLCAAGI